MNVRLVSFGQEVSLEDGSTTNLITMRLPNGASLQAVVSEEGLRNIINAHSGAAPERSPPPSPHPAPPVGSGDFTFGGDYRPAQGAQPWTPDPVPGRPTVTTDEAGNPVVHDLGGVDVEDVLEGGLDEEGLDL